MCKPVVLLKIAVETFFSGFFDEQIYLKQKFCNIVLLPVLINLLTKSINLIKKKY